MVKLSTPRALDNESSGGADERDPWISNDGLRLYYTFKQTGSGNNSDIYLATRADNKSTTIFPPGQRQLNLSTTGNNECRPALTSDEKILVLSTDRGTVNGQFNIAIDTRSDVGQSFGTPDSNHLAAVNGATLGTDHHDPFLSADGLRLYFAPTGTNGEHIALATRPDLNSNFSAGTLLDVINSTANNDGDPALSLDELILVFSSDRAGGQKGTNLWYATRSATGQPFSAPMLIPNVNSDDADGDPMLSADGCTLYFSTTRNGGGYDLFSATVTL